MRGGRHAYGVLRLPNELGEGFDDPLGVVVVGGGMDVPELGGDLVEANGALNKTIATE